MRIISRKEDFIVRTCIDYDYNEKEIFAHFDKYRTDDKYKDLKDFNWQTTETRQDKKAREQRKKDYIEKKRADERLKR